MMRRTTLVAALLCAGCATLPPPPPSDMRPYPGFAKTRASAASAAENAAAVRAGYKSAVIVNRRVFYCRSPQRGLVDPYAEWDVCEPKPEEHQPGEREYDAQDEWLDKYGDDWMSEACERPLKQRTQQIQRAQKQGFALHCPSDDEAPQ